MGGRDVDEITSRIMRVLMINDLAMKCNLSGNNHKIQLGNSSIVETVYSKYKTIEHGSRRNIHVKPLATINTPCQTTMLFLFYFFKVPIHMQIQFTKTYFHTEIITWNK